jgi:nickel transport protein
MRLLRLPAASGHVTALGAGVLLLMAPAAPVQAHAIESSLERLSDLNAPTLQLESRFSTGEPAGNAAVRLVPPQGESIVLGQTNPEGQLQFHLPRQASTDWELQVDAGPGHRDYLELDDSLMGTAAADSSPPARRSPLARAHNQAHAWLSQRSHLLVGLTGMGLGAASLLRLSRRRH